MHRYSQIFCRTAQAGNRAISIAIEQETHLSLQSGLAVQKYQAINVKQCDS